MSRKKHYRTPSMGSEKGFSMVSILRLFLGASLRRVVYDLLSELTSGRKSGIVEVRNGGEPVQKE